MNLRSSIEMTGQELAANVAPSVVIQERHPLFVAREAAAASKIISAFALSKPKTSTGAIVAGALAAFLIAPASAQEPIAGATAIASDEALATQLQNPVANLISLPFQFNYDNGIGPKDADRVTLNIQPVIPFELNEDWLLISRTILPVIWLDSIADGVDSAFGLGDTVQSLFLSPKEPVGGWILGAGPVALIPTATDSAFQSRQLGLGPTVVGLRQHDGWTYGVLANHIWGVTNPDSRDQVNASFLQPFLVYTWPSATSVSLNTESIYDWDAEQWTVPLNASVSQVVSLGGQPISFQFGGRYYAEAPSGGPEWGLRFNITFLFPE